MNRLPEFTRLQWVSQKAKEIWQPRVDAVHREALNSEITTMKKGLRRVALASLTKLEFNQLRLPASLKCKLLDILKQPDMFSATACPPKEGEPFMLRTVVGKEKDVNRFLKAWVSRDETVVGHLLGYPDCCIQNFVKHWGEKRDFTWQMMGIQSSLTRGVMTPEFNCNQMYVKLGLRPIFHMPCSIRCLSSQELGNAYLTLWPKQERRWLSEILRWPVEWSALHGAAEIRTPVFKIVTDTEPTSVEHVIQFAGRISPPEGAAEGNRFPYGGEEDTFSNNGFRRLEGMREAHSTILRAANEAKDIKTISDPGCGNGVLLDALGLMYPRVEGLIGVDYNHHAIMQGRRLFPGIGFIECNIFDVPNRTYPAYNYLDADMIVLMPGRLLERQDRADEFVKNLKFKYLLLYGYTDYGSRVVELRDRYWPNLKERSISVNDDSVAILLEKP
jgi:hypothetical protein